MFSLPLHYNCFIKLYVSVANIFIFDIRRQVEKEDFLMKNGLVDDLSHVSNRTVLVRFSDLVYFFTLSTLSYLSRFVKTYTCEIPPSPPSKGGSLESPPSKGGSLESPPSQRGAKSPLTEGSKVPPHRGEQSPPSQRGAKSPLTGGSKVPPHRGEQSPPSQGGAKSPFDKGDLGG